MLRDVARAGVGKNVGSVAFCAYQWIGTRLLAVLCHHNYVHAMSAILHVLAIMRFATLARIRKLGLEPQRGLASASKSEHPVVCVCRTTS